MKNYIVYIALFLFSPSTSATDMTLLDNNIGKDIVNIVLEFGAPFRMFVLPDGDTEMEYLFPKNMLCQPESIRYIFIIGKDNLIKKWTSEYGCPRE